MGTETTQQTGTETQQSANPSTANQPNPASAGGAGVREHGQEYSSEQVAAWKRQAEQVNGMRSIYDAASRAGLKTERDIADWAPALTSLREQGISPQKLAALFKAEKASGETNHDSMANVEEIVGREFSKREKELLTRMATKEHESAFMGDMAELEDAKIGAWLGENNNDLLRKIARDAALGRYFTDTSLAKTYPQDHPLAGQVMPIGKDGIGKIRDTVSGSVAGIRAAILKEIGSAAGRPSPKMVPSGTGGGGTPTTEKRGDGFPTRDEATAALAAIRARKGR